MLLWQRQNSDLLTRNFFASRFFLLSFACHAVFCFALLFLYKDQQHQLLMNVGQMIPSAAQVRLLPLSMSKPAYQVLGIKGDKKGGKGGDPSRGKQQKKEMQKKSPTTLVSQKKSAASSKKTEKAKKAAAQKVLQEKKRKQEEKNRKLQEKKKEEMRSKEPEKKVTQEPLQEEKVHDEPLAQKEEVVAPKKVIAPQALPQGKEEEVSVQEGQDFMYLTQQELDALGVQRKLQECLFEAWTVPVGIPAGIIVEALITVGWDGVIVAIEYLKKSTILMYDLSIQEALEQVSFPHEVWGKQITLVFKP